MDQRADQRIGGDAGQQQQGGMEGGRLQVHRADAGDEADEAAGRQVDIAERHH